MDEKTIIRFLNAEAPTDIKKQTGINHIAFYQIKKEEGWSDLIEPFSSVVLPKIKGKKHVYALPYCKEKCLVDFTFEIKPKTFYNYLNMEKKDKVFIETYFSNLKKLNFFRERQAQFDEKRIERERIVKEKEEKEIIKKIKKLLP